MTTARCDYGTIQNAASKRRGVAMVLAMVTALVLSPLYVNSSENETHYYLESRLWNSGLVLPMLLAGLIVAIKTTSSSSSSSSSVADYSSSPSSSRVLRIERSSWGLAGILGMLLFLLYWQHSVQHFFSR